jgi:type II secretory pathway pseudopilin PulG
MLLSVMLVMTLMLITLSIAIPRIAQQIKREKEEELLHRGREYAVAIKRFYHKNGTYPVSIEQLESTNNQRFLRKRYRDPMTEKGEWKLVHIGEAQITIPTTAAANNNQGNSLTTTPNNPPTGAAGSSGFGSNSGASGLAGGSSIGSSGFNSGNQGLGGGGGLGSSGLGSGSQSLSSPTPTASPTGNQPSGTGQLGTLTTQNIATSGPGAQGGGPIIGVASTSTQTSIKEFNNANEYDKWMFVYDPRVEQAGSGGVMIATPLGSGGASSTPGGSQSIPQPVQPVRVPAPTPSPQ